MKTWEVFLKKAGREEFRHAGAMQAPDAELALVLARESYCRRAEGAEMWLVERGDIVVAEPEVLAANADKPHRHNDGTRIAEHRRDVRDATKAEASS